MRDLLVFLVVVGTLPMAFRRPYIGLLLFSWLAYMRPQDLCWGFARSMRFSFLVGITMLVGWYVNESERRRFTVWDLRTRLIVTIAVLVSISYAMAKVHSAYFNRYYFEFLKIIVVALFTVGQVDSKERLRWMLWTIALCLGFYGFKSGVFGMLGGGAQILRGPGGMMEDNNDFALALVMTIPLLHYLGRSEAGRYPLVRQGTLVAMALTIVAIVLTHSRGGFLALVGTLMWIAWRSGRLFTSVAVLFLMSVVFLLAAPQNVLDRLSTISEGGEESSARARLRAWGVAFNMIQGNPVFGVGLRNFKPRYRDYADTSPEDTRAYVAHNSYLQIWAEGGTLAFTVYVVLLLSVFVTCRFVYWKSRLRPGMGWAKDYARMLEATTVGFMIGAMFLNRGHFDLIYHFLALVSCLSLVAHREYLLGGASLQPERQRSGVEVSWRPAVTGPRTGARWGRL